MFTYYPIKLKLSCNIHWNVTATIKGVGAI